MGEELDELAKLRLEQRHLLDGIDPAYREEIETHLRTLTQPTGFSEYERYVLELAFRRIAQETVASLSESEFLEPMREHIEAEITEQFFTQKRGESYWREFGLRGAREDDPFADVAVAVRKAISGYKRTPFPGLDLEVAVRVERLIMSLAWAGELAGQDQLPPDATA